MRGMNFLGFSQKPFNKLWWNKTSNAVSMDEFDKFYLELLETY